MQSLFPVTQDFLYAILRLEDKNDPDFKIISDHISRVSEIITQENLHSFPDKQVNYEARFHTIRGFGIALDVLKNIFKSPSQILTEMKEQDEFVEAQQRVEKLSRIEEGEEE